MTSSQKESESGKSPKIPFYQDVDGFRIPGVFSADAFRSAIAYKPCPDDLFIVTYPKCGTTWVQHIVGTILQKGKPFSSFLDYMLAMPFLELAGAESAKMMKKPGAIKMHVPFHLTPYSPKAKYIFIARNPKDCLVSFYHHTINGGLYQFTEGKFDDYFELFIEGKVDFGDYFDTLLSWYEHRNDPNVLFITYEQLKKDTRTFILKIAEFIDSKYKIMLDQDEEMLENVLHYSSFGFMKEHLRNEMSKMADICPEDLENNPDIPPALKQMVLGNIFQKDSQNVDFIRKGVVGDWKNYLSPMQNARLEKKFRERTMGTDIPEMWENDM